MKDKKAFTLIELLVVISIIALLMAILIPTLRAAKAAAAGSVCVSNLHSLSAAWFTYTIQNDDKIISSHVPDNAAEEGWIVCPINANGNPTGETPSCTLEDEKRGIREGSLYPYLKDEDVYHCPADKRYKRPATDQQYNVPKGGYVSYSIPAGLNGEDISGDYWCVVFSQVKNPSTKYVFVEENDQRGYNKGSWAFAGANWKESGEKWNWTDSMAVWHNKKSTLGWADGHADVHRWVDKRTIKMSERRIYKDDTLRHGHTDSLDVLFMADHWAPRRGEGCPR